MMVMDSIKFQSINLMDDGTVYGKFSQVKIETRGRVGMLPFGFTLVSSREVHPPSLITPLFCH